MTKDEALTTVREAGRLGRFSITKHGRDRMVLRNVQERDITRALRDAKTAVAGKDAYRWKVTGPDVDGDALDVAVDLYDGVVVVTVY